MIVEDRILSCGHPPSPHEEYTTGTGWTAYPEDGGQEICWECCHARDLQDLLTHDRFVAYLHQDGMDYTITNWPGGILGHVTAYSTARVGFHDCTGRRPLRYYVTVQDVHGQIWRGTSPGPGMYCRMRKVKGGKP